MINRLQKSLKEKDKGFTLVELLVVVVIIGILAGIAIPLFLSQKQKGVEAGIKSDLKNAATIQETYFIDASEYADQTAFEGTEFRETSGNSITVDSATSTTFCIDGSNADGTDQTFKYDSEAGVIETGTCSPVVRVTILPVAALICLWGAAAAATGCLAGERGTRCTRRPGIGP